MKYERMAYFICTRCGKPAVYETQDYILSFCEDCWKDIAHHKHVEPIDFKDNFNVTRFSSNGEKNTRVISFKEEWDRYLKNLEKG